MDDREKTREQLIEELQRLRQRVAELQESEGRRKRTEEETHSLGQLQESIIDAANIWLDVLDEKGNVVIWNKAAEEISGYLREEVVGHDKIWEWLYPDEEYRNEIFAEAITIIKEGGEERESETAIRRKDGQSRIISWNSRSLVDEMGNPIGSIALGYDITERKRAEAESEQLLAETENLARELTVLNELSQALTAHLSVEEVLDEAYRQASRLVDTTNFYIALYNPEMDEITFPYMVDSEQGDRSSLKGGKGLTGRVIETGKPLLLPTGATGLYQEAGQEIQHDEIGKPALSWLGVPLTIGDRVLGVMAVQSYTTPGLYNEHDRDLLTAIASPTAIALQNARLFAQIQQPAQRSQALYETSRALSSHLEEEPLMRAILEAIYRTLGCEHAAIAIVDEEAKTISDRHIIWRGEFDVFPEWIEKASYPLDHSDILADIARTGRTEIIGGWDERFNREIWDKFGHERLLRIFMPIKMLDRVIGVIEVGYDKREKGSVTEEEVQLLTAFIDQAAVAIENARMFEETQARAEELAVLNEMSRALTKMLDVDAVIASLYKYASRLIDTTNFYVALYHPEQDEVSFPFYAEGDQRRRPERRRGRKGLTEYIIRTREPLLIEENIAARLEELGIEMIGQEAQSWLGVPMTIGEQVIGVIAAQSYTTPRLYSERHRDLLSAIANQAAIAIENARLFAETQQTSFLMGLRVKELACLNDIGRKIVETPPIPEFLKWVAARIPSAMQYQQMCLAAVEFDGQVYGAAEAVSLPRQIVQALRIGSEVIGRVYIAYTEDYDFLDEESALLDDLIRRMSGYIESRRLFEEAQARAEELAALREVNLATLSTLERDQILEIMLDQLGRVIDYDTAAIKIITPDGKDKMVAGRGPVIYDQAMWDGFDVKDSKLVQEMKETRRAVVVHDAHTDERYARVGDWEAFPSWAGAPLFVRDDFVGYLAVEKTSPGFYDEKAIQLLGDFARAAAIALENARLYEDTQRELTERKQTEEALRVSEERFALAVQGANDGIWDWDFVNNTLYWSPRFKELLGYADDELDIGFDTFDSLLHPDDREHTKAAMEAHFKERGPYDVEQRLRTKSGEYRWFRARGQTLWDEAGNPIRGVGFSTDITERKQAEEALQQREAVLGAIALAAEKFLRPSDWEQDIQTVLAYLGQAADVSRVLIWEASTSDDGKYLISGRYEWIAPEAKLAPLVGLRNVPVFRRWRELLPRGEIVAGHVKDFSVREQQFFVPRGIKSILTVPIFVNGVWWGFMGFDQGGTEREWTETEIDALKTAASILGGALERRRAEEALERRAVQLQAAAEVSRATTSVLDLDELLRQVVNLVRERFGLYYAGLFLLDEERKFAVLRADAGEAGHKMLEAGHKLEVGGRSMVGWCIANAQARIALDVGEETVRFDNPLLPETRSEMALPLISRGQAIGAMTIQSTQAAAFSEEDITVLQTMADQLANAIENARLFEDTRNRLAQVTTLQETTKAVASTLELDDLLNLITQQATTLLQGDGGIINLVDWENKKEDEVVATTGSQAHTLGFRSPLEGSLSGWVTLHNQPVISNQLPNDERVDPRWRSGKAQGQNAAIAPLTVKDQVIGTLVVMDKPGGFNQADLDLLTVFANQAAIAIENARLFAETQQTSFLMGLRVKELACLNDIGRKIEETPPLPEFLQWVAGRIPLAMRHPDVCQAAIEFEGQIYGAVGAVSLPRQMVQALRIGGKIIGRIYIASTEDYGFLDEESALLGDIVRRVSGYIESRRLFEETQARAERERIIREISDQMQQAIDMEALMRITAEELNRALGGSRAYVRLGTEAESLSGEDRQRT